MSIATFTLITLFFYLVSLKLVSIIAYKRSVNTTEDYFLANRGVGIVALVATTVASVFSTGTVVSAPSEFFTKGGDYFWIFWFSFLPLIMVPLALRFWKLGKEKGFITPGEMIGDFHCSKRTQLIAATIGLLSLVPYAAAQLVAIGKTFEALTSGSITFEVGIMIVTAAIGLYLYYGGSRAVIWTDMVQGIIFCVLLLLSASLVLGWANGWENLTSNLTQNYPVKAKVGSASIHYFEMFLLCGSFLFLPHVWQRFYMAKSARVLSKNIVALPFVFMALFFAAWIIGTSGLVLFPEGLADGDFLLGAVFKEHAPYFGALVLVAAFAAGMSTIDSQLLSSGSIITKDLRPLIQKNGGKMLDYQFARLMTIALLLIVFLWSLTLKNTSVFSLIILGSSLTVVFIPTIFGMFFWKGSTEAGAFWSMSLGLITFLIKEFSSFSAYFPTKLGSISWALIIAVSVYLICSFFCNSSKLDPKRREYHQLLDEV